MAARDALAHRFSDRLLSVDDAIVFRWGVISGDGKRRTRQAPPVIDTFLAATAIEHDLFLVTRNVKDTRHSGAVIFNPWEDDPSRRSEEHTSELQSLMRISYAVFCLKKKKKLNNPTNNT